MVNFHDILILEYLLILCYIFNRSIDFETLKKDGTDMSNGRERSKRENFTEKKDCMHYPQWIEANKEEDFA